MSAVQVVDGFSSANRWLLYISMLLAPAQYASGVGNNCPSNIGFLAYNWYTQVRWYQAIRGRELHALSLLPHNFNFVYAFGYLGGISSGNIYMAIILGLGSAGVLILNNVSAWVSWATLQPEGYGEYQFFFFGWRTLTRGWHTFTLLWQVGDSVLSALMVIYGIQLSYYATKRTPDQLPWYYKKYVAIPLGAAIMLFISWPLILWTELIVSRNHIESPTDMVSVWLFIAQAVTMLLPSSDKAFGCLTGRYRPNPTKALARLTGDTQPPTPQRNGSESS